MQAVKSPIFCNECVLSFIKKQTKMTPLLQKHMRRCILLLPQSFITPNPQAKSASFFSRYLIQVSQVGPKIVL